MLAIPLSGAKAQFANGIRDSWNNLDPAVLDCLLTEYSLSPDQLANEGISANDSRIKSYLNECASYDSVPPPIQYTGYREGPDNVFTRTAKDLNTVGSQFFVDVTASEMGNGTWDALLKGVKARAESDCSADYSVYSFRFFAGKDPDSIAVGRSEPWVNALIQCASQPKETSDMATEMALDDLTEGEPGAGYFSVHSAVVNQGFDGAFDSVIKVLNQHGGRVLQLNKKDGTITAERQKTVQKEYEQKYFIMLDPVSTSTTRLTFKLIVGMPDLAASADSGIIFEDRAAADKHANDFIDEVQSAR